MPADGSHSASATARTTAPQTDSPSSAMTGNSSSNILSNASKNSPLLSPNKQLTAYYPHSPLRLIHSVVMYIVLYYTIYFGACPLEGEGVVARQRREFNRGASRRKPGGNRPLPQNPSLKPRLPATWGTGASGLKNSLTDLTLPHLRTARALPHLIGFFSPSNHPNASRNFGQSLASHCPRQRPVSAAGRLCVSVPKPFPSHPRPG